MKKIINSICSKILITLLLCTFLHAEVAAQLAVTPESNAQALLDEFLGVGVIVSNVQVNCADGSVGLFDGTASNIGIDQGIMLTSGQLSNAIGPNDQSGASTGNNSGGDPDLQDIVLVNTFDACVFEFDFVPISSTLTFNYVFGSEEYLEYVDQFNDVFAFLISGPGFNGLENIALIPGTGQAVTINNVNDIDNSQYYVDNGDGINNIDPLSTVQYDGFTTLLSVQVDVTPCETYHLKLAIADASDNLLDSGVFLEANSLGSDVTFDEPAVTCNSDGTFTLEFPFNGSNDGSTYSIVESDTGLGVSDVSFTDDGMVSTVTVGPYPAASSWNIEIEGGDFCGTTLDFSGAFDCCVGQSCTMDSSVTIRPCDDGNDCTVNDMETILNCDNSVCTPCGGTSLACNILACAPDIEVACSGEIAADITALQLENCGANPVVVAGEVMTGTSNSDCGESEGDTYTIQYSVTSDCGSVSTCLQTFTIVPGDLAVTCPDDVTGLACGDALPDAETTLPGSSNCSASVEFTVISAVDSDLPPSFCTGDNLAVTRTYTVMDDCGNEIECVQTFTFDADTEGPQVTCPDDVTGLVCGDELPAPEMILPGIDNCSPDVEYLVSFTVDSDMPTSFCTGDNLVVTRTYTVSDNCRNTVECVQTFTFEPDTEGPQIDCPADVTGLVCGDTLPPAETSFFGTDNCSSATEFTVISAVDSDFPDNFCDDSNLGIIRTYTVADDCGNETQCIQNFFFEADVEGPQIDCPADVTGLSCGDSLPPAETTISGTDNCGGTIQFVVLAVEDSDSPTNFCEDTNLSITRTYTIADDCGNETQCAQTFTFEQDTEGPQIDCPADVTGLSCGEDLPAAETTLSGTDNCGSTIEFAVTSVSDSEFPSSFCTGDNLARTRTYTVVDDCGNEAQCVQTFTYEADTEAPEVTCPADVSGLTCGDSLPPAEITLPGIDNCSPDVEYLVSSVVDSDMPTSFCAGDNLVVTRTYTVSDECRNTVECVQTFTFEADTEGPQVNCLPNVTGLVCGDHLPAAETTLFGTDNCSSATEFTVVSVEESNLPTNFCTDENLVVTRTYIVADECGNETQCVQTFTYESGSTPPSITCPDDCLIAVCPSDIHPGTPEFTTSCGASGTLTLTGPVIDGEPGFDGTTYTYTHTVTDDCGETASCHQVFTIVNGCKSIDFDYDDHGNPLHPDTEIFDQYEDFTVTTDAHLCTQLFDTGNPTSNDYDVGTPNEQYGGPGIGAGGDNNTEFQGNALIVSKDCGVPNETEGQLIFTFHCAVTIQTIDLLDMKCDHGEILLYDQNGDLIEEIPIPGYGVNSFNEFEVNVSGVYTMVVNLECGGAITAFSYCKDNEPGAECEATPECKDYTLDFEEPNYDWGEEDPFGDFDVGDQTYTISIMDGDNILVDTYEENGGLLVGIDPHNVHDEVVICYSLSQVSDGVSFDIVDLDYKYYENSSQQQEAICVYGLLGDDPTQIMPMVSSLDGGVEIDGSCGYATTNSSQSNDDESVLIEFTGCIDKVFIIYGTGPDSPTQYPTYSKIVIGEGIGFNSQVCPGSCLTDCTDGSGSGGGDDDGDGVCNDVDVCPGGNDFDDRDGDGIPDACDDICYDYHVDHSGCGADWQHGDTSGSTELGAETVDISIVDNDNIFVDSEAVGTGLQVGIDPHTTDDELIVCYDLSLSSSHVVFDIVDLDYKNSGSKQQEAVCVYGTLGGDPTQIFPTITSLDGSVAIEDNCGIATTNSAHSHDDESILVEFTECIDKITIVYGTGPDSPTHDPTYSKIIIGGGIFTVEQCPCVGCGGSEPCTADSSGDSDTDGDGVCNDDDICPGFDDNVDTDGDGIPDGCDDGSREDETTNASISLYPNPAYGSDNVTIEIDTETRGSAQIVILDALGRVIEVQNIELMNSITLYEMSTTRLASAVYFVQLQTNQWRTDAMKLVVVKP